MPICPKRAVLLSPGRNWEDTDRPPLSSVNIVSVCQLCDASLWDPECMTEDLGNGLDWDRHDWDFEETQATSTDSVRQEGLSNVQCETELLHHLTQNPTIEYEEFAWGTSYLACQSSSIAKRLQTIPQIHRGILTECKHYTAGAWLRAR